MFKNLIKNLVQYRIVLIIGGFLVVVFISVLIYSKVSASSKPDIKIEVKPTLSLSPCFNNQIPPKTSIVSPAEGSKYTTGDKISLTGIAVLECNNSKLDEKDLNWFLDTDTTPFTKGYTYNLEGLKAGDHKIKLVATSGNLKSEVIVNINVADPKPQVLGIKTPPPPAPKPDNPPTVKVLTIGNSNYNGDTLVPISVIFDLKLEIPMYHSELVLTGSVTDEDTNPTVKWFVDNIEVSQSKSLNYDFVVGDRSSGCNATKDFQIKFQSIDSKVQSSEVNFTIQARNQCAANGSLLNLNLELSL